MRSPMKPRVSMSIEVSLSSDLLFVLKQREQKFKVEELVLTWYHILAQADKCADVNYWEQL